MDAIEYFRIFDSDFLEISTITETDMPLPTLFGSHMDSVIDPQIVLYTAQRKITYLCHDATRE